MTTHTWLQQASTRLKTAGIENGRLDGLVLLEDVVGQNRANILAHPEQTLPPQHLAVLKDQLELRCQRIPLSHIRGKKEFYGRDFSVTAAVLEPRPESEAILGSLLHLDVTTPMAIIDVGTGSGCLAISAKHLYPEATVLAIDVDEQALAIAQQNAEQHDTTIQFIQANLLDTSQLAIATVSSSVVVLANLPYVPEKMTINPEARHEPALAIFGGNDGLDYYRQLFAQAANLPHPPNYVITESLPAQHPELERIAASCGYSLMRTNDFIQTFSYRSALPEV